MEVVGRMWVGQAKRGLSDLNKVEGESAMRRGRSSSNPRQNSLQMLSSSTRIPRSRPPNPLRKSHTTMCLPRIAAMCLIQGGVLGAVQDRSPVALPRKTKVAQAKTLRRVSWSCMITGRHHGLDLTEQGAQPRLFQPSHLRLAYRPSTLAPDRSLLLSAPRPITLMGSIRMMTCRHMEGVAAQGEQQVTLVQWAIAHQQVDNHFGGRSRTSSRITVVPPPEPHRTTLVSAIRQRRRASSLPFPSSSRVRRSGKARSGLAGTLRRMARRVKEAPGTPGQSPMSNGRALLPVVGDMVGTTPAAMRILEISSA